MFDKLFQTWTGRSFFLEDLTHAYKIIFGPVNEQAAILVLKDLGDFCRAYHAEGTFDPDPYRHAMLEGRRQVWQRIQNHLHLDEKKIMALYMDHQINLTEGEE